MGTNYYLHVGVCPTCGRAEEVLHIGKSSAGWCFALHVLPERGINTLADWEQEWGPSRHYREIRDEYGEVVTPEELLRSITERSWEDSEPQSPAWYMENHAEPGPKGLARHRIGQHSVGHGPGTWDYVLGEFC